jgi:cyclopropane fatty-acyl-phospholipid synthase-like methyltransferase
MWRRVFYLLSYFRQPPWDTGISPPELLAFIESRPPGRALDLGCGTGVNAITLAQRGWRVTGVDFIGRAIRSARRKARQANVTVDFRQDDVTRLAGVAGPFDLALDIGCFHSLSPQARQTYVQNLERLLAPAGTFLMYAFFKQPGSSGSGLEPADLELLSRHLRLAQRQDGLERGRGASAWLTYQRIELG